LGVVLLWAHLVLIVDFPQTGEKDFAGQLVNLHPPKFRLDGWTQSMRAKSSLQDRNVSLPCVVLIYAAVLVPVALRPRDSSSSINSR
jgi:hypothetical protein